MSNKTSPCTLYLSGKHKWNFVRNVTLKDISLGPRGSQMHIRWRGEYKCACGEFRIGVSRPEPNACT